MFQARLEPIYRLIRRRFKIEVESLENIRPEKNYIFAANHQSIIDIPIIFACLVPITSTKINLFLSHKFHRFLFPITLPLEVIPINMNKNSSPRVRDFNQKQLVTGSGLLARGNSVLIYPEGIISGGKEGRIIRGETGVIRLALMSGIPILPIGISGSNQAYPWLLKTYNPFQFNLEMPIRIKIGQELTYPEYSRLDLTSHTEQTRDTLRRLTEELMRVLSQLSGLPQVSST